MPFHFQYIVPGRNISRRLLNQNVFELPRVFPVNVLLEQRLTTLKWCPVGILANYRSDVRSHHVKDLVLWRKRTRVSWSD